MTADPRITPFNGRVAHTSLQGQVTAEAFTDGEAALIAVPVTDLCRTPNGPRDRQCLMGESFSALDEHNGWTYGISDKDGYVGWIVSAALDRHSPLAAPTHRVQARQSYLKSTPGLKEMGPVAALSMGSQLAVQAIHDGWAELAGQQPRYVPAPHLVTLSSPTTDPATLAETLLGTPYLWGGNSAFGVDCSGLIQMALNACGQDCPGDSDQQEAAFPAIDGTDLKRGDLVFWAGHVAMMLDATTLIHANGHHMAVVTEPLQDATRRIAEAGDGPVTSYRRPLVS